VTNRARHWPELAWGIFLKEGSGIDTGTASASAAAQAGSEVGWTREAGPVGSGMDLAALRAGDSSTGLGMTCSEPGAFASSLRDSINDLEGVPGLPKARAVDDPLIMVPMRNWGDFVEGDD
jgi:hypothetical protein